MIFLILFALLTCTIQTTSTNEPCLCKYLSCGRNPRNGVYHTVAQLVEQNIMSAISGDLDEARIPFTGNGIPRRDVAQNGAVIMFGKRLAKTRDSVVNLASLVNDGDMYRLVLPGSPLSYPSSSTGASMAAGDLSTISQAGLMMDDQDNLMPVDEMMFGEEETKTSTVTSNEELDFFEPKPKKRHKPFVPENNYVVKYSTDCADRWLKRPDEPHSIIHEYAILAVLNETRIAPQVFYVSPPSGLPDVRGDVPVHMRSKVLEDSFVHCKGMGAQTRFLVQERVGQSVFEWIQKVRDNNVDFYNSTAFSRAMLVVFGKALMILSILHSGGLVHGDIHLGNIAFRHPIDDLTKLEHVDSLDLVLIDFEHSFVFANSFNYPKFKGEPVHVLRGLNALPLSVWQLQGQRVGPRDDVFRLLFSIANVVSRFRLQKGIQRLFNANAEAEGLTGRKSRQQRRLEIQNMESAKRTSPLFQHSFSLVSRMVVGDDGQVSHEDQEKIRKFLEDINTYLQASCSHPDNAIDYPFIVGKIEAAMQLMPHP
jgi:hypothetical protein